MPLIVWACPNDRLIETLELVEYASLVSEDSDPCFSPGLGGFNYLGMVSANAFNDR